MSGSESIARRAERLAGAGRAARILDGSPAAAEAFAAWFLPAATAVARDSQSLLAEAMRGWLRLTGSDRYLSWFLRRTMAPLAMVARGPVGIGRALEAEHGFWSPDPRGRAAVLIPLWYPGLVEGPRATRHAICLDLVAAFVDGGFARRDGLADALGPGPGFIVTPCHDWPRRLRLYSDPMAWLAAGAAPGHYCILDWKSETGRDLLRLIGDGAVAAVCDDDAHAAQIRAIARPRRPKLTLEVAA